MRLSTVLKILATVLIVGVVALIASAKSLDSRRYTAFLAERAKAALGLELTMSGPIKLKLGLSPQLSFTGLDLALPGGSAAGSPLLSVDRIEARVALLPLLFRDLQIEQIRLIRPTLRLDRLPKAPAHAGGGLDLDRPGPGLAATHFALAEITVEDAAIIRRAEGRGQDRRLVLASGVLQPESVAGGPLTLKAEGNWNGTEFNLSGVVGSLNALLGTKPYPVQIKGTVSGAVVVARGTVAEPLLARGIDLQINAQGDELADLIKRSGLQTGQTTLPVIGPYKIAARLTNAGGTLGLDDIDAALGRRETLLLGAKGAIRDLAGTGLDLAISAEADGLGGLSRLIGIDLPSAGPLKLSGRLADTDNGWRLTGLKSVLGRSDFNGEIAVITGPRPRLVGRLASAVFAPGDLTFASPHGNDSGRAAPARPAILIADGRILPLAPLPLEFLRSFDLELSLVAQRLILGSANLADAAAELRLAGGRLDIGAFSARLGDGHVRGDARVDMSGRMPAMALHLAGADLDLAALTAEPPVVNGHAELALDLKAQGGNLRSLAGSLDGTVSLSLGETSLAKTGAGETLGKLFDGVDPALRQTDQVRLRCAGLRVAAKAGLVAADKGIALESPGAAVIGGGTLDLRTEALDLVFAAKGITPLHLRGMLGAPVLTAEAAKIVADPTPCRTLAARRR